MLNKIVLIGRLTKDPDLRYTPNGTAVCNFSLAVERNFKNQDGERDVDFVNIVVWRKQAENCANYLAKGRLVAVEGSLRQNRWEDEDGNKRSKLEVNANEVQFLDWGDKDKKEDNQEDNQDDIDVPF